MGFFDLFFNWISWSLWRLRWYSDGKSWTKKKPFSVERTSRLTFPSKRGEFKISSILLTIWPFDYLTVWLQYLDIDIIQSYMYWYCLINAFCLVLNRPIICDVVMLTFSAVLLALFFFFINPIVWSSVTPALLLYLRPECHYKPEIFFIAWFVVFKWFFGRLSRADLVGKANRNAEMRKSDRERTLKVKTILPTNDFKHNIATRLTTTSLSVRPVEYHFGWLAFPSRWKLTERLTDVEHCTASAAAAASVVAFFYCQRIKVVEITSSEVIGLVANHHAAARYHLFAFDIMLVPSSR